jgi:hypothetical protein
MVYQTRIGPLCTYERSPADQGRKTQQGEISMTISLDATEYTFQGEGITASYFPDGAGGPTTSPRSSRSSWPKGRFWAAR